MSDLLGNLISRARQLAKAGEMQEAHSLAAELTRLYPSLCEAWVLGAYLHALDQDYVSAVAVLSEAINLNSLEPGLFFHRGRNEIKLGQDRAALDDFSRGLDLCDQFDNDYYRETLLFMRAEALLRLGRKAEARADLARVRDGFTIWTYRLVSKEALLGECLRAD
jgi:tetratricopeptide (TPR) repeat protein